MKVLAAALHNITIWSAFLGWTLAQVTKLIRHYLKTRRLDLSYLVRTGGMPSSHSCMACALATSVGLRSGFGSTVFAVTLAFAGVVMFDAQSVRRAAGLQARLLNQILEELFKEHHLSQQKLVEFLGHTQVEVFFGMAMGVGVALLTHFFFG